MNNVAANSLYGLSLGGLEYDDHGNVDTRILDNIIVNNEGFGVSLSHAEGRTANLIIDHNLYFGNGWRPYEQGGLWGAGAMVVRQGDSWQRYETLGHVQAATPWEGHGASGDSRFLDYDPADHDLHDGSWPDFRIAMDSPAVDGGVETLPASLVALLDRFGIADFRSGRAYDMGRYEAGPPPAAHRLWFPALLWR